MRAIEGYCLRAEPLPAAFVGLYKGLPQPGVTFDLAEQGMLGAVQYVGIPLVRRPRAAIVVEIEVVIEPPCLDWHDILCWE